MCKNMTIPTHLAVTLFGYGRGARQNLDFNVAVIEAYTVLANTNPWVYYSEKVCGSFLKPDP